MLVKIKRNIFVLIYLFLSVTNTVNTSPGLGWLDPECLEHIQKKNFSCVQKYKHSFGQASAKKPTVRIGEERFDVEEEEFGCGQRKVAAANIVGGEASQPGEWPWMARLVYTRSDQVACSGQGDIYRRDNDQTKLYTLRH